jgi:hypothetical protein
MVSLRAESEPSQVARTREQTAIRPGVSTTERISSTGPLRAGGGSGFVARSSAGGGAGTILSPAEATQLQQTQPSGEDGEDRVRNNNHKHSGNSTIKMKKSRSDRYDQE